MSLINEALKKAQRQRALDNAPLSSAPSGVAAAAVTTHVRVASHKRSHAALLWFGLGLVALGAGATALVMHYGFGPATQETPRLAPATPPPAAAPAPVDPAPASPPSPPSPAVAETEAPLVMLPPIASPTPSSAPAAAAEPPPPAPTPIQTPAPTPATATVAPVAVVPVAAPLSPAEREAQVYSFLNTIRLSGVRGLGSEARVLMNERVWRLNDIVSPELGLRLSDVRANLLVFTDAQGKTYEKPY